MVSEDRNKSRWKIIKEVNLSTVLTILVLLWTATSSLDTARAETDKRITSVEQELDHQKAMFQMQQEATVEKIGELNKKIDKLTDRLDELLSELRKEKL